MSDKLPAVDRTPGGGRIITLDEGDFPVEDTELSQALGHKQHQGWAPAALARELLQIPLWFNPESAAKYEGVPMRRFYHHRDQGMRARYAIETFNPLKRTHERNQCSSHGLLRFLDLDVLMALTYQATQRRSRGVTINQAEFMRTMGHENLTKAPYMELKASFERLRHTMIKVYTVDDNGDPVGGAERTYQLVTSCEEEPRPHRGSPVELTIAIGDWWLQALRDTKWQLVDVGAYVHLARNHRLKGMARVLYLYLASLRRSKDDYFQAKLEWIQERFARRRDQFGGRFRNEHPLVEGSSLREAIDILRAEGVIKLYQVDVPEANPLEGYLRGFFQPAKRFAQYLRDDLKPRQLSLLEEPDIFDAERDPKMIDSSLSKTPDYNEYLEALLTHCQKTVHVPSALILKARDAGWTVLQLLHVMVKSMNGIRDNLPAYASSIIRNGIANPSIRSDFDSLNDEDQSVLAAISTHDRSPRWKDGRVVYHKI